MRLSAFSRTVTLQPDSFLNTFLSRRIYISSPGFAVFQNRILQKMKGHGSRLATAPSAVHYEARLPDIDIAALRLVNNSHFK